MPRYRVKVTEKHVDYVWLDAPDRETAEIQASQYSECDFDVLYECEVVEEISP